MSLRGLAGAAALLVAGCAPSPPPGPALVLVTLDTFRQDHLGCAGNPRVRTPHLDRIARRGTLWTEAFTPVPLTTPSHATILTGRTPRAHGVLRNRMRLSPGVPTVTRALGEAGYRTGAVVSSRVVLDPELGLNQGFAAYEVVEPAALPASGEGAQTTARAIDWLDANGGPGSFLWVHYFDAHLPYLPPDPWPRVYGAPGDGPALLHGSAVEDLGEAEAEALRARYAGEVSFLDLCVGRLARRLEGGAGPGVLMVTADHGEGLGAHAGYFGHDVLLYDTSLRIPLLLAPFARGAAPPAKGSLCPELARTMDLAPTLAGLAGLAPDPESEGRDLLREPEPEGDDRVLVAETHPDPDKSAPLYALRTDVAKVIRLPRAARHESYDLAADPQERHDLGPEPPSLYRTLAEDLDLDLRNRPPGTARTVDDERGGLDETTRKALESLGYVGG